MESIALFINKLIDYGRLVKFSHSIFALPFALAGAVLATKYQTLSIEKLIWILVAMVTARSAAMGFNRLVDILYDLKNPRTRDRHLPKRIMRPGEVRLFIIIFSVLFIFAAYQLNALCFYLSPVALGIMFLYSYTKRFTSFSHYVLGLALGISPVGAWLAITGYFSLEAVILGCAVVFWVAGFDIIYACQDYDFDKKTNLYSIPRLLGLKGALLIAKSSHIFSFILLGILSWLVPMQFIYTAGLIIIAGILTYEHSLVKADNLTDLNQAFFTMNGIISVIFFTAVLGDKVLL